MNMALINVRNLGVTLGAALFVNLNLAVAAGDRIGIVAANGRGKSTLLRCLAGTLDSTTGDVTRTRGLRIGYVEQIVPDNLLNTSFYDMVLQALPDEQKEAESWRVDVVLASLDVPDELRERTLAQLSGGSRSCQDRAAGRLAEQSAARCAGGDLQP
jgi:ATPase subunit of ABC transporter with duplicated ATPase domains